MGKVFQESGIRKQVGAAVFISDKTDFKPKLFRRNRVHFTQVMETTNQEDINYILDRCVEYKYTQFHKTSATKYKVTD